LSEDYGGYAEPSFSELNISPDAFDTWPPDGDATIKVMLLDMDETDETKAVTIFDGYGTPEQFDHEGVEFTLYSTGYTATIAEDATQTGTVLSLMTSYCSTLGLTLDSTHARSTSPAVSYTPSSEELMIDVMDEMCAFFTHGFRIIDGTLYLFDMLTTGDIAEVTEFSMQEATYGKAEPLIEVTCGDYSVSGSSTYGDDVSISTAYHTTGAAINAALTNIKTVLEKDVVEIESTTGQVSINVLDDFSVYDESTKAATSITAKAKSVLYNFDNDTVNIEGIGVLS
jgi:hypothetical protein